MDPETVRVLREIAPKNLSSRSRLDQVPTELQPSPKRMTAFIKNCDNLNEELESCINWRGGYNGAGRPYAQFWFRGRNRQVRKLMWYWFRFDESEESLPTWANLVLEAVCGNHRCVNPKHLRKSKPGRKKKSFGTKTFIRHRRRRHKKKKKKFRRRWKTTTNSFGPSEKITLGENVT